MLESRLSCPLSVSAECSPSVGAWQTLSAHSAGTRGALGEHSADTLSVQHSVNTQLALGGIGGVHILKMEIVNKEDI